MPYVTARVFLKEERTKTLRVPAHATMLELATHHAIFGSKRQIRSMVDITAAYHLRKNMTSRNLEAIQ
jgi:hypothetical protein